MFFRRSRPRVRFTLKLAAGAVVLGLAACGAAEPQVPTIERSASPTATALPDGAVSLKTLGFGNGPTQELFVPKTAELSYRVDQPNVVTLIFAQPSGPKLVEFYSASLPARGFTVTGLSDDSLTFTRPGWEGSFTSTDEVSGLTLRRVAEPSG